MFWSGEMGREENEGEGGEEETALIILPLLSYKFSDVVNSEEQDYGAVINQP